MISTRSQLSDDTIRDSTREIQHNLQLLDRKNWWYWWNAILVIMLLMGAIVVLSLPRLFPEDDPFYQLRLALAVRGLLGLVLIFNVYTLYQQHLLGQLRTNLAKQIEVATEQKQRAETLYELAILDPLTGLYNRRFGEERLRAEIARTQSCGDPLAVLLLDLDDFKKINDRFGHSVGDLVLKEFSRHVNKGIRASDIPVRLGGDEFLVVLPECPPDKVQLVLSRLGNFELELDNGKVAVSSSHGWAQYEPVDTPEQLIGRADEDLYAQKAARTVHAS